MSVLEYATKFNDLCRFGRNQVAAEEMKMDRFEQGLKGSIKSLIAGHTFDNYQEMYERAVKIALVLDETKRENKAAGLGKGKFEYDNRGQKGGNPKRFNSGGLQDKGKQAAPWQNRTPCNHRSRFHYGLCKGKLIQCYRCGKLGHKVINYPKVEWNRRRDAQATGPRTP